VLLYVPAENVERVIGVGFIAKNNARHELKTGVTLRTLGRPALPAILVAKKAKHVIARGKSRHFECICILVGLFVVDEFQLEQIGGYEKARCVLKWSPDVELIAVVLIRLHGKTLRKSPKQYSELGQ
jgi:hypothetical protein